MRVRVFVCACMCECVTLCVCVAVGVRVVFDISFFIFCLSAAGQVCTVKVRAPVEGSLRALRGRRGLGESTAGEDQN